MSRPAKPSLVRTLLAWMVLPACAWALSSAEWRSRSERIEALDPAAKDQLRRKWEWFQSHAEQRPALVKLHEQLETQPDGPKLRQVAERYYAWFSKLRPGQQRELLELPPAKRVEKVVEWRQAEIERERISHILSSEDVRAVLTWMNENGRFRGLGGRFTPDDKAPPREQLARVVGAYFRFGGPQRFLENVKEDDARRLIDTLTPATKQKLTATGKSPTEQAALLRDWLRKTAESEFWKSWKPADPDALWQFFSSLPREEQVALESLSAGDMLQTLQQRLFAERNNGGRRGFGPPGDDRDRPMGRGPLDGERPMGRGPLDGDRSPIRGPFAEPPPDGPRPPRPRVTGDERSE